MAMKRASDLGIDIAEIEEKRRAYRGLPPHTYWHPTVFDFELEAIFHRSWQYFGPLERVANPGDVMTGRIGNIPILVVRNKNNELNGFINVCRHRNYTVVSDNRRACRSLVCPYHGWTYGLDGRLNGVPRAEAEPDFNKKDFGLVSVSVDTWGPGVFVNPGANAGPFRETFTNLDPWTEEVGFIHDPSCYRLTREIVTPQKANWKLWYDNTSECYHCPQIHRDTFAQAFDVSSNDYLFRFENGMTNAAFETVVSDDDKAQKKLRSKLYRSFMLFPGCQIIELDDLMIMTKMVPTGPESCVFTAHYFAKDNAVPDRVDAWIDLWNVVMEEDKSAVETQQQNLKTARVPEFRYVSTQEQPIFFINDLIWDAYKKNLIDDSAK